MRIAMRAQHEEVAYRRWHIGASGELVAVKTFDLRTLSSRRQQKMVEREARVLRRLSDIPTVAKLIDVIQSSASVHFVLEYVRGGSLQQLLKSEGDETAKTTMLDVKCAMGWLVVKCTIPHCASMCHMRGSLAALDLQLYSCCPPSTLSYPTLPSPYSPYPTLTLPYPTLTLPNLAAPSAAAHLSDYFCQVDSASKGLNH